MKTNDVLVQLNEHKKYLEQLIPTINIDGKLILGKAMQGNYELINLFEHINELERANYANRDIQFSEDEARVKEIFDGFGEGVQENVLKCLNRIGVIHGRKFTDDDINMYSDSYYLPPHLLMEKTLTYKEFRLLVNYELDRMNRLCVANGDPEIY